MRSQTFEDDLEAWSGERALPHVSGLLCSTKNIRKVLWPFGTGNLSENFGKYDLIHFFQRFCQINKIYIEPFQQIFMDTYSTVHRLETKMLRNVAKFFGHLLFTDAISWEVLSCVRLTEDDTNSSSRIFIKILFQELAEYMGLKKLNERIKEP
jgi:MA3 domain